ncbi:MAG: lactoylglutathione lyase [Roseivirga sp.]|jgi:lactoylglutathione lyase
MQKITLSLALILFSALAWSQTSFDHMAIVVKDLEESKKFYTEALGFKNIEDPTGNPLIDWVENDKGQQIHMIQAELSAIKLTKSVHYSFAVLTLRPFTDNLQLRKIAYESWEGEKGGITIRPDGVRQVYLQDPNGYWIEINDRQF